MNKLQFHQCPWCGKKHWIDPDKVEWCVSGHRCDLPAADCDCERCQKSEPHEKGEPLCRGK